MNVNVFSIVLALVLALYFVFLYKKTGHMRNSKILPRAVAVIFSAGVILHFVIYYKTAVSRGSLYDMVTIVYYSVLHSFKMFMGNTPIYRMLGDFKNMPFLYQCFVTVFYMSLVTSAFLVFNFLSRSLYTRRWLKKHRNRIQAGKGGNSIFLGVNRYAEILAGNIRRDMRSDGKDGMILFIELPENNEKMARISIWDILRQFVSSRPDSKPDCPYDIILKVSDNMKGLIPWLQNPDNDVYILSDDMAENISLAERLMQHPSIRCHIYCHARREGLIAKYDGIADLENQLTIIDSSYLAVQGLKRNPDLHPVNYVEVCKENGRKAGYVSDEGFTSAIIGFGETGKESLSFLYEFGAFPDKYRNKAPFKCYVFDNEIEKASSEFLRKVPGLNRNEVEFHSESINTPDYWRKMSEIINRLNYVVVSLGDDKVTLNAAIDIAEFAFRYRRSSDPADNLHNFVILFRLCDPERMDILTLKSANQVFGDCLKPFGGKNEIWNHDIVANRSMNALAERFYNSYETLASGGVTMSWTDKLKSRSRGSYKERSKALRQVAQNHSNCLHMETKKRISDPYYHQFAANIVPPADFDGSAHFIGDDGDVARVMEYLAVGEKLRWNASHEILGYVKGEETDDQIKTHRYLGTYDELDPQVRHYDWLVVRNSLI